MSEPGEWLEGDTARTHDGKLDAVLVVCSKVERGRHRLEGTLRRRVGGYVAIACYYIIVYGTQGHCEL